MSLFDAYIVVDWSANGAPKTGRDSIWIAASGGVLENPSTRSQARTRVLLLLHQYAQEDKRTLVGFDFPYGYPIGFGSALGLNGGLPPWRRTWQLLSQSVADASDNTNNRFGAAAKLNESCDAPPGPFWSCPAGSAKASLTVTKPRFPFQAKRTALGEYRNTDAALNLRGTRVQSVWKLFTAGSVGSQALTGIPVVAALRDDPALAGFSKVWPFETGFTARPSPPKGPFVLHAEIWPGVVPTRLNAHRVRDAAQVLTLLTHFSDLDRRGKLAPLFDTPESLASSAIKSCVDEEGWILGA